MGREHYRVIIEGWRLGNLGAVTVAWLRDFRSGCSLSTCGQGSGRDQAAPEGVNPRPTRKVLLRLLTVPLPTPAPVKTCHLNSSPKTEKKNSLLLRQMLHKVILGFFSLLLQRKCTPKGQAHHSGKKPQTSEVRLMSRLDLYILSFP